MPELRRAVKRLIIAFMLLTAAAVGCGKKDEPVLLTMEKLTEMNGGIEPEISYHKDGSIREISGKTARNPVTDERSAYDAIYGVSGILGISDPENELVFDRVSEGRVSKKYVFAQYYKGIPVLGGSVSVMAENGTGYAENIFSSYVNVGNVITEPAVTKEEAVRTVAESSGNAVEDDPELVIKEDRLFWSVTMLTEPPEQVLVNAAVN
ncbi:MAG: hypothetical protein J6K77_04000 [Ruminococcus sp.]|nr:hypothetical protein [Ruminococcus sp.]